MVTFNSEGIVGIVVEWAQLRPRRKTLQTLRAFDLNAKPYP